MHSLPEPNRRGLREFGLQTGVLVAGLFGMVFPWALDHTYPTWPWLVCGVLVTWALAAPNSLRPVYKGWMRLGLLLGRITTPLVLGLVFFVLITPMALVMRLAGRDLLARRFDAQAKSYRVASLPLSRNSVERPY